jgi:Polyketide cyclase / dehydrase and lipid transport
MKKGTSGDSSIYVNAGPEKVYELVSDVTRMGEWSPETVRCEWIGGAGGAAVGARFKGVNKRGVARWSTTPTVVVADRGREFGFVVGHLGRDMTKWTFRFEATSTGTSVVESFTMLADQPWYYRLADRLLMGVKDRKANLEEGMHRTLERIKAVAEGGPPAT